MSFKAFVHFISVNKLNGIKLFITFSYYHLMSIESIGIAPLSFLILLFCFFFFSWSIWVKFYQFYWSSQRTSILFHWFFFLHCFCFQLHWFLLFIISFCLFMLGLICSSFSISYKLRLLIYNLSISYKHLIV